MADPSVSQRLCPTCRLTLSPDAFYRGCSECKGCKRQRSKLNRVAQTRKVIAFERFLGVLADLAKATSDTSRPEVVIP